MNCLNTLGKQLLKNKVKKKGFCYSSIVNCGHWEVTTNVGDKRTKTTTL